MMRLACSIVIAACAALSVPARAATDWESVLTAYYILRATAQNCSAIQMTPAESQILSEAIANAEIRSGMPLAARDDLATDLADTVKESPAICAQTAPTFHERIKNVAAVPK